MLRRFNIEQAARPKSDLYVDLLAALNSRRVDLLDNPKLINQLCALEQRTVRSGRDSVDHPSGGHDESPTRWRALRPLSALIGGLVWSSVGDSTEALVRTAMASKFGDAFGTLLMCRPAARSGCGEEIIGRSKARDRACHRRSCSTGEPRLSEPSASEKQPGKVGAFSYLVGG
jgi:hypothetical protein